MRASGVDTNELSPKRKRLRETQLTRSQALMFSPILPSQNPKDNDHTPNGVTGSENMPWTSPWPQQTPTMKLAPTTIEVAESCMAAAQGESKVNEQKETALTLLALQTLASTPETPEANPVASREALASDFGFCATRCTCKNTNCLKLYCMCFRLGIYCQPSVCECKNCCNRSTTKGGAHPSDCSCPACRSLRVQQEVLRIALSEEVSKVPCNCRTNKCLQLYCRCFQSKCRCGPRCRCQGCHNSVNQGDQDEERLKAVESILLRRINAFDKKRDRSSVTRCNCKRRYVH